VTKTEVNSATVTVHCYDYGAYVTMTAATAVGGKTKWAHVVDGTELGTRIPRDDDTNHIADAWAYNTGNATDDAETSPAGDGTNGDGFTRYTEYRGFLSMGNYIRLNASLKEVFVFDYIGYGIGDYPNLGPTVYQVGQYERTILNVVNEYRETAPGQAQKCIVLLSDEGWDPVLYGHCLPDPPGVGTPNDQTYIYLYTGHIAADAQALFGENWEAPATSMLQRVIGHECGHYTNIHHHAQGGCVMRTPCDDWFNIPHTYCTNNPGCKYLFKLH